jgi:hypothetical protein
MATIYIDTSEAREGSLLINAASYTPISNLESLTGADILVSPWDDLPNPLKVNFPPHEAILHRHCQNGCLIQRKSGHDLLGSIHKLDHILYRMLQWCKNPWLVYTRIRQSRNGLAIVTGSKRRSKWRWSSISGKLDSWRDCGGSVKSLLCDTDLPDWLESRRIAVDKWQDEPEKVLSGKTPQRPIAIRSDEQNFFNTLRLFPPGVGEKSVENLITYTATKLHLPPTAWVVCQVASSEESLKVRGWGKVRMQDMREWLGYDGTLLKEGRLYELTDVMIGDIVPVNMKGER